MGSPGGNHSTVTPIQPSLSDLFLSFLRLGLTAFGGPAMVVYIKELAVREKGWLSEDQIRPGIALCQLIPGATVMQLAAYVGLRLRDIKGGLVCFLGFGLPAFFLMTALSVIYEQTRQVELTRGVYLGLRIIVVAMTSSATWSFGRGNLKRWQDLAIALGAYLVVRLGLNPVVCILGAGALGLLLYRHGAGQDQRKEAKTVAPHLKSLFFTGLCFPLAVGALWVFDPILSELALLMLQIDLFAFGGGFGSVPLMHHLVVEVKGWMDAKSFMDGIALGQVTPGPIVITGTFVGYMLKGFPGAFIGTVAVFAPSFLILNLTAPYFNLIQGNRYVARATSGVLASFVGLLLATTVRFAIEIPWDAKGATMALAAFLCLRRGVGIIWIVLGGATISFFIL